MSGAEPLIAIGLASNIVQFFDFTTQLCIRIEEICTSSSGLPKELEKQAKQLSGLSGVLKDLAQRPEGLTLAHGVLEQCLSEARTLESLLKRFEVGSDRGRFKNLKLAFQSMRQNKDIEKLQLHLGRVVSILTLQIQIWTGSSVSEGLKGQNNLRDLLQRILDSSTANGKGSEQFKPIWMVPVSRNPNFIEREEVLEQLKNQLLGQSGQYQRIAVLHGLAGIGKSQIALEFIYRHRSPDAGVFWVHASSIARFVDSYKRIASECQIPGRDDPNTDTLQLVQDWLETKCPFGWSMVVDNLDDRAGFLERSEDSEINKVLCEYVPQTVQGAILYTTRSRDIGIDLSPDKNPIMVQCLKFDEAQALLGESLVRDTPEDDQFTLFESLDYLPLAIAHAAAFMTKRRKKVGEYLNLIQDDSTRSQVLSQKNYIHDRAERSSESVVSTWWVTFRSIKRENARAAELLTMMSLLDRHEIPVSIMQESDESIFGFEEAIGLLEDFSLITTFSSVNSCHERTLEQLKEMIYDTRKTLVFGEMHRLVQESTKAWLSLPDSNAADTATKSLQSIGKCFKVIPEQIQLCNLLYPHLNASLCYNSEMFETSKKRFDDRPDDFSCRIVMLQELCQYLMLQTKFTQSEQHIQLAMSICKTYFSDHAQCTLKTMQIYGFVYCSTGRSEEACAIQGQVLRVYEEKLGYYHPETLRAVNQLGQLLISIGNLGEAERVLCDGLSENHQNLLESPEDEQSQRDLVETMTSLASVFVDQGEHQRALDLLNEALRKAELWHEDYDCGSTIKEELAKCFRQCGRYEDARNLMEPALERRRHFFGDAHPYTLHLRRELVILLWAEGRYDEAEELMKGVFEDWPDFNNADSPDRISALCDVGKMQYSRGKFEEAEVTFKRSFHMVIGRGQEWSGISTYGADDIQKEILQCLEIQGKLEEAKTYMFTSNQKAALDAEKPSELNRLRPKGKTVFAESPFGKPMATSMSKPAIPIKGSGPVEGHTEQTMTDLACRLLHQHKYEEVHQLGRDELAEMHQLGRDKLAWTKRMYGWDDSRTQGWVLNLALASERLGRLDESEDQWRQHLHWLDCHFSQHDTVVFQAHNAIAKFIARRGDFEAAEKACRRGLAIHPAHLKKMRPRLVTNTMIMLGSNLLLQGKFEEAVAELRLTYIRCVEDFGNYDTDTNHCLGLVTIIAEKTGNIDFAEKLYYALGATMALPSDSGEEDFDESASESGRDRVTMTLPSDCEKEDFDDSASENSRDRVTMALPSDGEEEPFDDSASKSDHGSDSSGWETTASDPDQNGE